MDQNDSQKISSDASPSTACNHELTSGAAALNGSDSRREFLRRSGSTVLAGSAIAGSVAQPSLALARSANAAGSDRIRMGLIGCGGRGTGAVCQAMNTDKFRVELHATGDAFADRMAGSIETCTDEHSDKVDVPNDRQFVGFDAFRKVLDCDLDMVVLATPPGFRPHHFDAAVDAGVNVFMEKPVAVDAPGIRKVLAAGKRAEEKGLSVAVGLQRRHERAYRETIDKLRDGIIGRMNFSRVYWNSGGVWQKERQDDQSELEYQMRNWYYFNWLCGDHIVEQHIHNMDVINWLLDDYPVMAQGQGGRLVRNGIDHGQIFDHHMVEYTFANGHKMFSQCRHIKDCWRQQSEFVHGSKGYANISAGQIFDLHGKEIFKSNEGKDARGGHQQEHYDLFDALAEGKVVNETEYGAKSTMTAILGRLATYSGKELRMDDAMKSNVSLCDLDTLTSMDSAAPLLPDENGRYEIPTPGRGADAVIDWKPKRKS